MFGKRHAEARGIAGPQPLREAQEARIQPSPLPVAEARPSRDLARRDDGQALARSQQRASQIIREQVFEQIDPTRALQTPRDELLEQIGEFVSTVAADQRLQVNVREQAVIAREILDDLLGYGPLETLLRDDTVNDILINGPNQIFVERFGHLELFPNRFRDEQQLLVVAQRIAASVGRRVDESSPMVDARLSDGSRVNIVIRPLSLIGPCISIRKFARNRASLDDLAARGSMSREMAEVLKIAGACRLNILISGGTGAGKTTLMNALSQSISEKERIVTIEDAAELQLQQPHVVSLETRAMNTENKGEVTIRDLMRNALRMRPDRIIVGEVRGGEVLDMLQAMNTGHDGSMSTLHANNPRDALVRLENMLYMTNLRMPAIAIRRQIVSAVHLIIQVERMRDGVRRVTSITEPVTMEGETIVSQEIFRFDFSGQVEDGRLVGSFVNEVKRPRFLSEAEHFGLGAKLIEALR